MTQHWAHVIMSWVLTLLVFGGLAIGAQLRHRAAERRLAQLETRKR